MAGRIRAGMRQDARPVAAMLARAFADDPLNTWIFPDERMRRRRLPQLFAAQLRAAQGGHGETDVMVADGQILGSALWSPPGEWLPTARQQLAGMVIFPLILRSRLPVAISAFNAIGRAHPHEPHWYLSGLGVDPPAQRAGVGAQLLAPRLARCDETGVPAYLEVGRERNVGYYEALGFVVTRQITLPGGGPAHWAMWRKPG